MDEVNQHYLDRVVSMADTTLVEATEDIVSGSGVKLVAKGGRIDGRVRDRLLEHKLRKPLESMLRVVGGVASRPIDRVAEDLLARHALLASLCGPRSARLVARALHDLRLSTALESMLSLYAEQGPRHLEHAVGVGLLAAALGQEWQAPGQAAMPTLLVAGLAHDFGELYIDPAILQAGETLTQSQWRHIAAHPVVGARVLRELAGAGPKVAEAVLHHHERLDGFGYPQALAGSALPPASQALGLAEALMGICESGRAPGERAAIAVKLMPGEFDRHLRDRVAQAAAAVRGSDDAEQRLAPADPAALAQQAVALGCALQQVQHEHGGLEASLQAGSSGLRELAGRLFERTRRIHAAFSSTGLDAHPASTLQQHFAAMDAAQHGETAIVLRELQWRLRELARELHSRAAALGGPGADAGDALRARALLDAFERAMARCRPAVAAPARHTSDARADATAR
ncbi:HD-GYP domain-containing protein [Aquabacterium sp.]|uniref:HD-GYP domain-containing protein n=1 Tax=Aquabacterium sp. TaxID=1872578 RepID=UPI00378446BA